MTGPSITRLIVTGIWTTSFSTPPTASSCTLTSMCALKKACASECQRSCPSGVCLQSLVGGRLGQHALTLYPNVGVCPTMMLLICKINYASACCLSNAVLYIINCFVAVPSARRLTQVMTAALGAPGGVDGGAFRSAAEVTLAALRARR